MNPSAHIRACNSEIERSQKENQKLINLLSNERDQFGKRETELMAELSEEKTKNHATALKECRELYEELRAVKIKYEEKAWAYRHVAIQSSYQGTNLSDETICKLMDDEAERFIREQACNKP